MNEVWKDISGYDGLYQVSSFGRFRSLDTILKMKNGIDRFHEGHVIQPYVANDGYLMINLTKDSVRRSYKAHRIVAEAFIANPFKRPFVNHKNENKQDNRVENLEWCTNKYNIRYGTTQKKRIEKIGWKVRQFSADGTYIQTFISMRAASRILKIPMNGIYDNCNGKTKSYKGFIFQKVKG